MRILAIGDIHGCTTAFDTLLAAVNLQPSDRLITLGDYIDRGPDSKGVIERLITLHDTGQLVALRGNHEQMILNVRSRGEEFTWLYGCGRDATLASYSVCGDRGKLADVPDNHWDFLENRCLKWYETDQHFFVHANADPNLPLAIQPDHMLFWDSFENSERHFSGKTMVCGHTSQKSGLPVNIGHAICIDTWAYGKGWLTCLDVTSGRVWQANQAGEQRTAWIDEFQQR
ncbi:serine/threonine protein phosphatase [Microcoleus sp. FACHB-831]|uniref:metallophosphoesterase family protein n=1 Tax=Microcoleus sp. FACHB-831 TaxID=2692827 RepID=UPI0016839D05|nr:metallophosphoesterase family protein [Microcoleus sp. FACHB-831]MBD1922332.1 serine/threonine protein phosphatase [Microcoleus sp. FACHB-831]